MQALVVHLALEAPLIVTEIDAFIDIIRYAVANAVGRTGGGWEGG